MKQDMDKEFVYFSLDTAVKDSESGSYLEGYAIVWDQLSEDLGGYRARIRRGAVEKAINSGADVYALVDHDDHKPLANLSAGSLKLTADDKGLFAKVGPLPKTSYANDALEQVRMKLKKGMSIQFNKKDAKIKWAMENGTKVRDIYSIDKLTEVSVVTKPAFSQTDIAESFSLESATEKKEQKTNVPKTNKVTVTKQGNTSMPLSWTEIKKLEEQRSVAFSQANALKDKNELSEDESAEMDRLCGEVDQYDAKIADAKNTYFSRSTPRSNVMQQADFANRDGVQFSLKGAGFKQKDVKRYSLQRAIQRKMNGQPLDGIEAEVNEEMIKFSGKQPSGFFFPTGPMNDSEQYDVPLNVGATTQTAGGAISTTLLMNNFIEYLTGLTLANRLGVQTLNNLTGSFAIPKGTSGGNAYWVTEGQDVGQSTPTIGQVPLSPKTVGTFTDVTRKFILQTSMTVETWIRNELAKAIALEIDRVIFAGTGVGPQPRGLLNTTGVQTFASSGDAFADAVMAETLVENVNALNGSLAYVTRPSGKGILKTMPTVANGSTMVWEDDKMNNYAAYSSTQIPAGPGSYGETPLIFGDWSQIVTAYWGGLDVNVDTASLSKSGGIRIVALQDFDLAVRLAQAFAITYFD